MGCFSFHPRKTLTTGEGGLITTDNEDLTRQAQMLRNHGGSLEGKTHIFTFREFGFNYRLTELQAALGLSQMKKLAESIETRNKIADQYRKRLADLDFLTLPPVPDYGERIYQSYVVTLDQDLDRDKIIERLAAKGIETTLGTYALHAQPAYTTLGYKPGDLPHSFAAFKQTLSLPIHARLTENEIDFICKSLREVI
jgi:dTDP-4-amino-4,6-dideoxygalactose transaminase